MDDETKAAFASATESVKNTLTLSTALLTLSVTFAKDVNKSPTNLAVWILESSWTALLLGVVFGVTTLMAITGTLAKTRPVAGDLLYKPNVQRPMTVAVLSFLAGVALTAVFGMLSV